MKHLHKAVHHARKRLQHPEIKGILILFALTLLLPILILAVAQQTQTKQQAAACPGTEFCTTGMGCSTANGIVDTANFCGSSTTVCCIPAGQPTPTPNNVQAKWSCKTPGNACVQDNVNGTDLNQANCDQLCVAKAASNLPVPGTISCGNQLTGRCFTGSCPDPNYPVPAGSSTCTNSYSNGICCNRINNTAGNTNNPCAGLALNPQCGLNNGGSGFYCGNNSACVAGGANGVLYTCTKTATGYITSNATQCTNADCRIAIGANNPDYCGSGSSSSSGGGSTNPPGNSNTPGWQCISNQCTNTTSGQIDNAKCTPNCAAGITNSNTWACVNHACTNSSTGVVDNTKCTQSCVTCACANQGFGTPHNDFTCKDPNGAVVSSGFCSRNAICDTTQPSSPTNPCYTPPLNKAICTCYSGTKDNNSFSCTNDPTKSWFENLLNVPHTCGYDDNGSILECSGGTSQYPIDPCKQAGLVAQSTHNVVYMAATIPNQTTPRTSINVEYHFLNPLAMNTQILASAKVLSAQAIIIKTQLTFDSKSNEYSNPHININSVPPGNYFVFAKANGFLVAQLKDFSGNKTLTVNPTKDFLTKAVNLLPGDIAPNPSGDNFIDINDYNNLLNCFGKTPTNSCKLDDLNNDGVIDQKDFDLLISRFGVFGDSYTEPNFTCTSDPACKNGQATIQLCALKCTKNIDF